MISPFGQRLLILGGWEKALIAAGVLVACEPLFPVECRYPDPPCRQRAYVLDLAEAGGETLRDSAGIRLLDTLPVRGRVESVSEAVSGLLPGGGGRAWASCMPACWDSFKPDSLLLTTDIVTKGGDTLQAGHNFVGDSLHSGIRAEAGHTWFQIDSLAGFRDTLFEIRFVGKVDGAIKSTVQTIRITNPALLLH